MRILTVGSRTPWGPAQDLAPLREGVLHVSTASHGGLYVDGPAWAYLRDQYPAFARLSSPRGWFEQDAAAALVYLAFPELAGNPHRLEVCHAQVWDQWPDAYRTHFPERVPAESRTLRHREWLAAHADAFIVTSAHAVAPSWREPLPPDYVGVYATHTGNGKVIPLMVPKAWYDTRGEFGYVIPEPCPPDIKYWPDIS